MEKIRSRPSRNLRPGHLVGGFEQRAKNTADFYCEVVAPLSEMINGILRVSISQNL